MYKGKFGRIFLSASLMMSPGLMPIANAASRDHAPLAQTGKTLIAENVADLPVIEDLMQAIFAAYGGKEKFAALEANCTAYGSCRVFANGQSYISKFCETHKGNKVRIDLSAQDKEPVRQAVAGKTADNATTLVFDGASAWKAQGDQVSDLVGHTAKLLEQDADHRPYALSHFQDHSYSFTLLGRTQHRQVPCYAIEMTKQGATPVTFYIDQATSLIQAISYSVYDEQSKTTSEITRDYQLWKSALKTMVAFKQTESTNSQVTTELSIDVINDNAVADDVFQKPKPLSSLHLEKPAVVPFEFSNQEILIKTRLNSSQPATFLLDTGSSTTIVDRGVAASLLLDKQGKINVESASGNVSSNTTILKTMEIGPVTLNNVPAVITDLSWQSKQLGELVAGIIGNNVLSQYAITIDYGGKAIIFENADSYKAGDKPMAIPFSPGNAPQIKATVNGTNEQAFLVDTGSAFNSLPGTIGHQIDKSGKSTSEGMGLDGLPVRLGTATVDTLTLAGITLHKIAFNYPLDAAKSPGKLTNDNLGILGNDFWQNFILTIDYKQHKLALVRNVIAQKKQEIANLVTTGDTNLIIQRSYRLAEQIYQKALAIAVSANDKLAEARVLGRLGCLHRMMAKDLSRQDQTPIAYDYFKKAMDTARLAEADKNQIVLPHDLTARQIEARILGDWGLLYSDNNRSDEAEMTIKTGLDRDNNDPEVNVDYAVLLYRSRQYAPMQEYLYKALELDPANWHALWYQVKLADLTNDTAGSQKALKTILQYYPGSKLAEEKLNTLLKPADKSP